MPSGTYGWLTFAQAKQQLAQRLDDPNNIHWSDAELGLYIKEALTTWQALTGYWRARGTVPLSPGVPFYDLPTLLQDSSSNFILGMTTTDADVVKLMEYHLLEPPTIPWTGTEMFNLTELTDALQNARDKFLSDTGVVVTHSIIPVTATALGQFPVDDHVVDIRRVAWEP